MKFKKDKATKNLEIPAIEQIEKELNREQYKMRYAQVFRGTVFVLITVAAVAVLVATLFLPVLRIYGSSMTPSLTEKDIVVSVKGMGYDRGDVISFYYNNKILVKRIVAFAGEYVDIDKDGNVYVNGELLDEPYLKEKALGECNIKLPYQVPDDRVFVCGDHRSTSIDSRNRSVGCVAEEQIVGKIVFRVWPIKECGIVN